MGGLVGIAGGLSLALGAWSGIKGIVKLGADMEQTKVSFTTMLGSAEKANNLIKNLNKLSNKTPFENVDLQKNANLLLNFGIANKKIIPTLKMIGDVSGGNKDKLNSLSLAYAQIQSTGKLMGQDLLQMINAGFNPLQVISEKTGVSIGKLKEQMSKGAISAQMVEGAFQAVTSKGGRFYQMMEKQSQTFTGRLSTLKGKLTNLGIAMGEKLLPFASKFVSIGLRMVDFLPQIPVYFEAIKTTIDENAISFGLIGIAIAALSAEMLYAKAQSLAFTVSMKVQALWTKVAAAGQWLWNAALTANPIGLVVAGVAALGAAVVWAYNKVGWFRGGIDAAWVSLKGFAVGIKDLVINRIKEMITGISGIGKTLMLFFKGKWKDAWEEGKKATKNLTGFGSGASAKFINDMKKVGKKAGLAYDAGVKEVEDKKSTKKKFGSVIKKKSVIADITTNDNTTGNSLLDTTAIQNGINSINGGGSKQTNINVSYEKLIENLTIQSETISEGVDEMEDKIKAALMRILNSTNQLQTQ
ncbi:tape measure protein [Tenacibaculum maritimum]|nr:tape measure protein [Tenacibaculum maritimum]